jgi:hypothetical protein
VIGGGLSHRTRRKLAILILVVGLPVYIIVAVNVVELFDRPGILVELLIYVVLGIVWALPLKAIFSGVGRADPDDDGHDAPGERDEGPNARRDVPAHGADAERPEAMRGPGREDRG